MEIDPEAGSELTCRAHPIPDRRAPLAVCAVVLSTCILSACTAGTANVGTGTAPSSEQLLPAEDEGMADRNRQTALETSVSGHTVRWKNPESGSSGSLTPLRTWKTTKGTYCRAYREKIMLGSGERINRRGIACRSPDMIWRSA